MSGIILIRAAAAPSEVSSNIDREDNYKFKTLLHKHLSEMDYVALSRVKKIQEVTSGQRVY